MTYVLLKKTWRYLIFDLMVVNGLSIVQRSFNTRLGVKIDKLE